MPRDSVFDSKIVVLTKPRLARCIVDGKTRILNISPQTVMNRNLWTAKPMGFSTGTRTGNALIEKAFGSCSRKGLSATARLRDESGLSNSFVTAHLLVVNRTAFIAVGHRFSEQNRPQPALLRLFRHER